VRRHISGGKDSGLQGDRFEKTIMGCLHEGSSEESVASRFRDKRSIISTKARNLVEPVKKQISKNTIRVALKC